MKLDSKVLKRLKGRPYYAYLYARNVLKAPLPPSLESSFVNDPRSAYLYAKHVLKGRLPDHVHAGLVLGTFENKDDQISLKMYLTEFCGG